MQYKKIDDERVEITGEAPKTIKTVDDLITEKKAIEMMLQMDNSILQKRIKMNEARLEEIEKDIEEFEKLGVKPKVDAITDVISEPVVSEPIE